MSWIDADGIEIDPPRRDPPRRDPPPDAIHDVRATILFWNYMKQAGVPVRDIASCFGISHVVVLEYISKIPEDIKEDYASADLVGRLRAAFPKGRRPKSGSDVRRFLQAPLAHDLP